MYEKYGYGGFLDNVVQSDITEIPGADNLHRPDGAIRRLMDDYADLYGAVHTELLVNGGSAGLMAAVMALVPRGGRILMARSSHFAAFSAVRLAGIEPVFVLPGKDGLIAAADIESALAEDRNEEGAHISAVLITSPDYYGNVSDVAAIAAAAHRHGVPLIVDQAHGSHLLFFDPYLSEPFSAERCGADVVIDSTHKTLLSFTGTGVLNICSDRADRDGIVRILSMLQTTSPSYILLAGLEMNERILRKEGGELAGRWLSDLEFFREEAAKIPGLRVRSGPRVDPSKLYVSVHAGGGVLSGAAFERMLTTRNVWPEMHDREGVLLMTGAGSRREDYEKALAVLREIVCEKTITENLLPEEPEGLPEPVLPEYAGVPERCVLMPLREAAGRVAGEAVTLYPPGIPAICPGERYTPETVLEIERAAAFGDTVMGLSGDGNVLVGTE